MNAITILVVVGVIILLYFAIRRFMQDVSMLQAGVSDGTVMVVFQPSNSGNNTSNSGNFTYSVWYYINDWNYMYGELKYLFARVNQSSTADPTSITSLDALQPCPAVVFGATDNNMNICLTCFGGSSSTENLINHTEIVNIPIQRWVNLFISVYGRTLDVYLDGKLVRTAVLPGTANVNPNSPTYLTPMGGFYGWTAKFQYWANASDPQTAWNVYKAGYGGTMLTSLFGKYQVNVSLLNDGQVTGSVQV